MSIKSNCFSISLKCIDESLRFRDSVTYVIQIMQCFTSWYFIIKSLFCIGTAYYRQFTLVLIIKFNQEICYFERFLPNTQNTFVLKARMPHFPSKVCFYKSSPQQHHFNRIMFLKVQP